MTISNAQMIKILYAPAHYTDSSHLPDSVQTFTVGNPVLLNHWILTHCQLLDLPDSWSSARMPASLMLTGWFRLATAAHLAGGYLLRNRLLSQSTMLMSDARLLSFISLPLGHQVELQNGGQNVNTMALGAAFILSLTPDLPQGLRQRFLLCFPADITLQPLTTAATPDNITLLRMAVNYANDYHICG